VEAAGRREEYQQVFLDVHGGGSYHDALSDPKVNHDHRQDFRRGPARSARRLRAAAATPRSPSRTYSAPRRPHAGVGAASGSADQRANTNRTSARQADATKVRPDSTFADSLAATAMGSAAIPGMRASVDISQPLREAASLDTCATVTANTVTFNNCTISESGFNISLSGTVSVSAGTVTWAINGTFSGAEQGVSFNITHHQSGSFTVTDTRVTGNSVSDFGGTVSSGADRQLRPRHRGRRRSDLPDLASFCVTSGNIEVKRVWTARPNGATGAAFADAGIKLTWTGCNALTGSRTAARAVAVF